MVFDFSAEILLLVSMADGNKLKCSMLGQTLAGIGRFNDALCIIPTGLHKPTAPGRLLSGILSRGC